jgi:ComF family protein
MALDAVYCAGAYEGRLRTLIQHFKFREMRPLEDFLGQVLAQGLPLEADFDLVIPVPMHWLRVLMRGYNQAELLARKLSRMRGIPYANPMRKKFLVRRQSALRGSARRKNVEGVYSVKRSHEVAGKKVLLVDDVYTTGSTANVCARLLKQAGASYVAVIALARTDRRVYAAPEAAIAVSHLA